MPKWRYAIPVSPIDKVPIGMGGVTGANADLPQNAPMYTQVDPGPNTIPGAAPGKNPAYGSVGNHGRPVRG